MIDCLSRYFFTVFLLSSIALLTGCVAHKPMIPELRAQRIENITLVIEEGAFAYVPLGLNTRLTAAARQRGVLTDHRQVFVNDLVSGLQKRGISVTVLPLPYVDRVMMSDRWPLPAALERLPHGQPAYYLDIEFGQCFLSIEPCVNYKLNHAPTSRGAVTTGFQGVFGMYPRPDLGQASVVSFGTIEEAEARIDEFDAGVTVLRQKALDDLLKVLEAGPSRRK